MNKTSWHMLIAFGSAAALAAACTVSSGNGSSDNSGTTTRGSATSASGGTSSGGTKSTSTTGSTDTGTGGSAGAAGETGSGSETTTTGGTGGSGGGGPLECLEENAPTGEPGACKNLDPDANSCCTLCAAANCCDALSACYAVKPSNVCGGPVKGDIPGEMAAVQSCMIDNEAIPGTDEGSDLESCFAEAVDASSGPLCGLGTVSLETQDLALCVHGNQDGLGGCFEECFTDFDDSKCTYRN